MTFQKSISNRLAFGIPGEIFADGPTRVEVLTVQSADPANNVMGRAFTLSGEGFVQAGGAGNFAGILINPKSQSSHGDATGTLAPTLAVLNNVHGEFLGMGEIVVYLENAATIGDAVCFDTATGKLHAGAPGKDQAAVPNAKVTRYNTAGAGLAVIRLTN